MLLLLFAILLGAVKSQHIANHEFGYGNTTDEVYGPPDWHKEWDDCGHDHQSPINIATSRVVIKNYPDLKITFDSRGGLVTGELKNNGHSPTLEIDREKSQGTAKITGGPLRDNTYTLSQFHVHFGCENNRGSEHTLNGKQFAGEFHMVFENSGKFAVVALWLKPSSRGNPILGKFARLLPNIIEVGTSKEVDKSDGIRLMGLLLKNNNGGEGDNGRNGRNGRNGDNGGDGRNGRNGDNEGNGNNGDNGNGDDKKEVILTHYYHYKGSLTTPPCYETVKWLVLKPKLRASNYQLRQFRKLKAHYGRFPDLMCDNYRPIQPLNGRNVYSVNNIVNTDD